jgi:hypothetical protein
MMSSGTEARSCRYRLPGSVECGVGDFLDQGVCFSVHDAIALLDGGPSDGLSEMAFARARRPEKERVFALRHETGGGEFVYDGPIRLPVEFKIKAGQGTVRIAESGEFDASLKQAVLLSALQFIGDEDGDDVESRHLFGLGLPEPRLQDSGHAGEAQPTQRVIEFNEVH